MKTIYLVINPKAEQNKVFLSRDKAEACVAKLRADGIKNARVVLADIL